MRIIILLISSLSFLSLSTEQETRNIFLDKNRVVCDSLNAKYYQVIYSKTTDKQLQETVETFLINGVIESSKTYSNFSESILNGTSKYFYPSGSTEVTMKYKKNKLHGELKSFYETGELRRLDIYRNGRLKIGNCYTKLGTDTIYYPREVMPRFNGGDSGLMRYLIKTVKYPNIAQENNIHGTVHIRFTITKTGSVSDIEVTNKIDPLLEAEAKRVIGLMDGKWKPGLYENKEVDVKYAMPIHFLLN